MGKQTGSRIWRRAWVAAGVIVGVLLVGAVLAAAFAPFVYAELMPRLQPHVIVDPAPAKIAKGRMFDDYFVVSSRRAASARMRPVASQSSACCRRAISANSTLHSNNLAECRPPRRAATSSLMRW